MSRTILLLFISYIAINFSCKIKQETPFAIKDFRPSIQSQLTKVVTRGYVNTSADIALWNNLSDHELRLLFKSEHPILRASALQEVFSRNTFNNFDVIMNHLDDTASIQYDDGEWGIRTSTVSDNMLEDGNWKNISQRNETIKAVITKHNYLASAYYVLPHIAAEEKYYLYIKQMAFRQREFREREYALYALAKFRKSEDTFFIRNLLTENRNFLGEYSFKLLSDFPNKHYFTVLEQYYPRAYNASLCMFDKKIYSIEAFITSVASYKDENSAILLQKILDGRPFLPCGSVYDSSDVADKLFRVIKDNACPAYCTLLQRFSKRIAEEEKNTFPPVIMDDVEKVPSHKTTQPVHWISYHFEKNIVL